MVAEDVLDRARRITGGTAVVETVRDLMAEVVRLRQRVTVGQAELDSVHEEIRSRLLPRIAGADHRADEWRDEALAAKAKLDDIRDLAENTSDSSTLGDPVVLRCDLEDILKDGQ